MFDKNGFMAYVDKRGVKMTAVARAMGICTTTLYRKINGESDFTRAEIQRCCDFFNVREMNDIFFAQEVSYTKQARAEPNRTA